MERQKHLLRGIPVLASLDIHKTVEFYKTNLGFNRIGYLDTNYAIIARDQFVLHFWKCDNKIHPENTSCYVDVENIDVLYEELKQFDVIHPNGSLENKPYGMREFSILDNDGNLIKFGQEL
ncbi:bleomycin resistance protein [Psychroserpens algicola]|uniref:VOC family protein n=1 Tax=Psychroserpens algicola TaxID=1719034 RepID=A0ABT0H802_9FLAO|nr:VOC family protein [Psychroserpens algicola]MCK8479980.1 VOC family protein [Psychroserpens algicola]